LASIRELSHLPIHLWQPATATRITVNASLQGLRLLLLSPNYRDGFNAGGGVTWAIGETGLKLIGDVRYNRFLSHANNEFVALTFGIVF
jgi:hypothetical protein